MLVDILTIFPRLFDHVFDYGMISQARKKGLFDLRVVGLRDFTGDKHRTVDDRPFGGGEGMVLKPEPIFLAVEQCRATSDFTPYSILLTPQGAVFNQSKANQLSMKEHIILICGRYEGVDQRVADHLVDEELSIGDFVVSGGEFPALLVVDALSRLIPGVVGKGLSILTESFMEGVLDYPQYTRPADFRGWSVPEVLLSGNHSEISRWRDAQGLSRTRARRPDLLVREG